MRVVRSLVTAVAAAALAACVSGPAPPAPAPVPAPIPQPAQPPAPPPAPPPADWQDAPASPGDWSDFGGADGPGTRFQSGGIGFSLRCERDNGITVAVSGAQPATVTIRTSYGERSLPATPFHLPASDALFDQMAFSRGHFLVQGDGASDLIVPAWPELARVVEECRR
jgi:hypothetical protein